MTDEHTRKPEMDEPRSEPGAATPEGYTKEEPAATELGEPGTPGAGMTPDAPHAADADLVGQGDAPADSIATTGGATPVGTAARTGVTVTDGVVVDPVAADALAHHDAVTHMDEHTTTSDDDHGHAESSLGPIDWGKWGYAIVGGIAAVIVLAFFYIAVGGVLG